MTWRSNPFFAKETSILVEGECECTPVEVAGRLFLFVFSWTDGSPIRIFDLLTGAHVVSLPFGFVLGSSVVDETGRVHVFGVSVTESKRTRFYKAIVSYDPAADHWSIGGVRPCFQPPAGSLVYNSSICQGKAEHGRWVMMYEYGDAAGFHGRFAVSDDLETWAPFGGDWQPTSYAACGKIDLIGDDYFIVYLRQPDAPAYRFVSFVGRTKDLVASPSGSSPYNPDFFYASAPLGNDPSVQFLAADGPGNEGINASDVDWVEKDGQTHIVYSIGDQLGWKAIKRATFAGTRQAMKELYFPA